MMNSTFMVQLSKLTLNHPMTLAIIAVTVLLYVTMMGGTAAVADMPGENVTVRNIPDAVFHCLFSIPEYQRELVRCLMPDVDIEGMAIRKRDVETVFAYGQHNDLSLAVGDEYVCMVEAQTHWDWAILHRLYLYGAEWMRRYMHAREITPYTVRAEQLPKERYFVIYAGGGVKKFLKEDISLKSDFFHGNAQIDLSAKVLWKEDDTIVGQYIRFCHIQKRQYSKLKSCSDELVRRRKALLETIRICKEQNILREFLQEKEAEVIDMFDYFFSQEYTTHCLVKEAKEEGLKEGRTAGLEEGRTAGLEEGRTAGLEEGVSGLVRYLQRTGHTREDTWHQMKSIYSLSDEKIEEYLNRYWKA